MILLRKTLILPMVTSVLLQWGAPCRAHEDAQAEVRIRARQLVSSMSLSEKISQLMNDAPAIPRLGVPAYNWWNEALHGVARAGLATVFPQAIGLAASWNVPLMYRVATAISDEGRAKHHHAVAQGQRGIYQGLTMWSPNINIYRDPRWGRGQETYGEDPVLTSHLGLAFVKGLQGDDPRYFKTIATPKHFAVHSGPEANRSGFDAKVSERDLKDTYLPAFKALVVEGQAYSLMCSYNRINGVPACANKMLLNDIARHEWGFSGFVVSDCDAVSDIYRHHRWTSSPEAAAAAALRAGNDLNCGNFYKHLESAVSRHLVEEAEIDQSVERLMMARIKLGMFDDPNNQPYAQIPYSVVDSPKHRALAREAAQESIVLLKNNGILPLVRPAMKIAVVGPKARDEEIMLGNYNGTPSYITSVLEGIQAAAVADKHEVIFEGSHRKDARSAAQKSDVVVLVLGIGQQDQDEGRDRSGIELPSAQSKLLAEMLATGKPVIVVNLAGSPLDLREAERSAAAIVYAWYPGQEGGAAVADVLFGRYNPAGRLPVTFYNATADLPPFDSYDMKGRTYRYVEKPVLYPFGFGLSFTRFAYSNLSVSSSTIRAGESLTVSLDVANVGERDGDEVVQLYLQSEQVPYPAPQIALKHFRRIHLPAGSTQRVSFEVSPQDFALLDTKNTWVLAPSRFILHAAGANPLGGRQTPVVSHPVELTGSLSLEAP